jgi:molybdopterin-biosynthesis enzyme MoeA-like protein
MGFGVIIIGDEILSGRRVDKHLAKVIELLSARGLSLGWAEYVGDDRARITATLARSLASGDIVFSTGGIGATPDDHTRQCAAAALGVPLELHPEAAALIRERIRDMHPPGSGQPVDLDAPENRHRLNMGVFPLGASIIPNGYNKIPGFSLGDHHFVPGFPVMAWPMIEWVLDTKYAHLHHAVAHAERSLYVFELMESTLTPLMEKIEADFPGVRVFSLPSVGDADRGGVFARRHIDLGVKGEPEAVAAAFVKLREGVHLLGGDIVEPDAGAGGSAPGSVKG